MKQRVTFTCVVAGIPTPTVTWYHNGAQLSAGGVISISGNTLNISSLSVGHTGMYQCFANNVVNSTQRSWALQVRTPSKGIKFHHPTFIPLSPPPQTHTHTHHTHSVMYQQEFITVRVCNFHMISIPATWLGSRGNQQ